jgi:hypothetical protein
MRARRRRAWNADLAAAEDEVAWFARTLVPGLRRAGSADQMEGGWAVGSSRIAAVEDRLTVLEASAPDDAGRTRARNLRDAVRMGQARIQELAGSEATETRLRTLEEVAADLEAAMRAASPGE